MESITVIVTGFMPDWLGYAVRLAVCDAVHEMRSAT